MIIEREKMKSSYPTVNHNLIDGVDDISIIETERGVYSAFCNKQGYPPRYLFKLKNPPVDNRYVNNIDELQKDRTRTMVRLARDFLAHERNYFGFGNYFERKK